MKNGMTRAAVCPLCGGTYRGHPALSRTDGKTRICPDCGTRQAMAAMGADSAEQERVVAVIHKYAAAGTR